MATFAVILNEPNDALVGTLKEAYPEPDHYKLTEDVYLVTGDLLIDDITRTLGFEEAEPAVGAVFRLNGSYGGHSYRTLWDWLRRAEMLRVHA